MESASELDEAAPSPAQLGQLDLVSKEQLHQAYKRSLERYQKYRGMFTEAVRKFKEQEKELKKMRVSFLYLLNTEVCVVCKSFFICPIVGGVG